MQRERTEGTPESHVGGTLISVAQNHFFLKVLLGAPPSRKDLGLFHPAPKEVETKRERVLGDQGD